MTSTSNPTLEWRTEPPTSGESYVISQLEGERISIPGSKGVFRVLASSKQTQGKIAVFTSAAVLSDAPGFHYHNEAHDVFLVTKGFLKLWNGDKCKILGPGDFAYIPPNVIHQPLMMGPHTETFGLIAPGDWIDFFRYIAEAYSGIITPEFDERNIKQHIIGKMMKADREYDVVFQPKHQGAEVTPFDEADTVIPSAQEPYYLQANTGPRWVAGSVLSRPFITTAQCGGRFAMTSLESSKDYSGKGNLLARYMTFKTVDHCFSVQEGTLVIKLKDGQSYTLHSGETAVIPAGQGFALEFASKYVQVFTFTSGDGVESLVHKVGSPFKGFVLPEEALSLDEKALDSVAESVGVLLD